VLLKSYATEGLAGYRIQVIWNIMYVEKNISWFDAKDGGTAVLWKIRDHTLSDVASHP